MKDAGKDVKALNGETRTRPAPAASIPWRKRLGALGIAAPFLVFCVIPLMSMWTQPGLEEWEVALGIGWLVAYMALFAGAWLSADAFPPEGTRPWMLLAICAAMLVLDFASWPYLSEGSLYMLCYLPPLAVMMPRSWIYRYFAFVAVVAAVRLVLDSSNPQMWLAVAFVIANVAVMGGRINRSYAERDERLRHAALLQHVAEVQRLTLAADLHDIVGQQLTAIALKASLVENLLSSAQSASHDRTAADGAGMDDGGNAGRNADKGGNAGRNGDEGEGGPESPMPSAGAFQAAAREAGDINRLARQALADVRRVVAGMRQTSFDQEIASAKVLLAAIDSNPHVTVSWRCDPSQIPSASAVGRFGPYVIREACTNIARHAHNASRVVIDIGPAALSVWDNGQQRARTQVHNDANPANPHDAKPSAPCGETIGHAQADGRTEAPSWGLRGLAARVEGFATITWGPDERAGGWRVRLEAADPLHETGGAR